MSDNKPTLNSLPRTIQMMGTRKRIITTQKGNLLVKGIKQNEKGMYVVSLFNGETLHYSKDAAKNAMFWVKDWVPEEVKAEATPA